MAGKPANSRSLVSQQAAISNALLGRRVESVEQGGEPSIRIEVPVKTSEPLESDRDHDDFEVPVDGENSGLRAQETRTDQLIAEQEANVEHALATGQPVTFVNAQGDTEQVSVTQASDGTYTIRAEDGHPLQVDLDLEDEDELTALTNITNYYSEVPSHLREAVETINVQSEPAEHGAAFYSPGERSLTFGRGLRYLDEHTFNHEFGHGIAYHVANQQDSIGENFLDIFRGERNDGVPDGYVEAAQADSAQVTDYAGTNPRENFAETWLFYVDARQRGEEALAAFEEVYPNQTELLNQIYDGNY